MFLNVKFFAITLGLGLIAVTVASADTVQYTAAPGSYPQVTSALSLEFGTTAFPPLNETAQTTYLVPGAGPVDLTFRFKADTGTFLFNFGYYHITPALNAIDTSTDAGKFAYANLALAPGNATLVFDDVIDNPGATRTISVNGGDLFGFFLIPDATLSLFQTSPGSFAVNGTGSATFGISGPLRFPFFSNSAVNPGDRDQLMSFSGTSIVTNEPTNLFAWEDLTRATIPGNPFPSDNAFNDLIFAVEGVNVIPEPASAAFIGGVALAALFWMRRRG